MNLASAQILALGPEAGAAQALLDAVRRVGRRPEGRMALVTHLSRLRPPAPRPHHRRIARAMLQDAALRHDGQVFELRSGDLVLLCRRDAPQPGREAPGRDAAGDPLALSATLGRLLRADAVDPSGLVSLWDLQHDADALLDYAAAQLGPAILPARGEEEPPVQPDRLDALAALVGRLQPIDLLQRQTAMLVPPGRPRGLPGTEAGGLLPAYRELLVSLDVLEAQLPPGAGLARDPYLVRHLAGSLDRRVIAILSGLPPDSAGFAAPDGQRLHLNLTLPGILSDGFAALAGAHPARLAAEVSVMEACADPSGFAAARARLQALGVKLVLDGVSHGALLLCRPWRLGAALLKLDWSPDIAALPPAEAARLEAALRRLAPTELVLQKADSEAALRWGLAQGIRCFQGRHADAMLAAARMGACPAAGGCTLRQCMERGLATGGAGRRACANPRLLDAAAPARPRLQAAMA